MVSEFEVLDFSNTHILTFQEMNMSNFDFGLTSNIEKNSKQYLNFDFGVFTYPYFSFQEHVHVEFRFGTSVI